MLNIKLYTFFAFVFCVGCSNPGDVMIDAESAKVVGNVDDFVAAGGLGSGESIIKLHKQDHIIRVGDFQWTKNHMGNWHTVGKPRYTPKNAKDANAIAKFMGE